LVLITFIQAAIGSVGKEQQPSAAQGLAAYLKAEEASRLKAEEAARLKAEEDAQKKIEEITPPAVDPHEEDSLVTNSGVAAAQAVDSAGGREPSGLLLVALRALLVVLAAGPARQRGQADRAGPRLQGRKVAAEGVPGPPPAPIAPAREAQPGPLARAPQGSRQHGQHVRRQVQRPQGAHEEDGQHDELQAGDVARPLLARLLARPAPEVLRHHGARGGERGEGGG